MNFHELNDIVSIYSYTSEGKRDYEWDKAQIVLWDPVQQKEYELIFSGSSKADDPKDYKIHFNIKEKK